MGPQQSAEWKEDRQLLTALTTPAPLPSGGGARSRRLTGADTNRKATYCYRHGPDSTCLRAADEARMRAIQAELRNLPETDQKTVAQIWSMYFAARPQVRELTLQGILTQCCFPQLSSISRLVHEQLRVDFIAALPVEIALRILCCLDPVSLCKAAQVSRRWRELADSDLIWVRKCEQHIDRACSTCGWSLPSPERRRLKEWTTRQRQLERTSRSADPNTLSPISNNATAALDKAGADVGSFYIPTSLRPELHTPTSPALDCQSNTGAKVSLNLSQFRVHDPNSRHARPWKAVYRDRFKIGLNWRLGRCTVKTFRGHTGGVTCLQLEETVLASGSHDTTIKIWDIETGREVRTLRGHTGAVRALQFDDGKLVSASLDHTIKIWNWRTGVCLSTLRCHTKGVLSLQFDDEFLASASQDKTVKILNFNSKETLTLDGHIDSVNHISVSTRSSTIFSASDDMTCRLWDMRSGHCIRTFEGHVGHAQQALPMPDDFEPDNDCLSRASLNTPDTWSISSERAAEPTTTTTELSLTPPVQHSDLYLRSCYGVGFTSDCDRPLPPRYLLTAALDATVRLWDTATGQCLKTFFGHLEGIWSLVGDSVRVVTGANDGMVKIWDPRTGQCQRTFSGPRGAVTCVGLSDSRFASGSEDCEVRVYCFKDLFSKCPEDVQDAD